MTPRVSFTLEDFIQIADAAHDEGYDEGYADGSSVSEHEEPSYNDGYEDGFKHGHDEGRAFGYDEGYDEARKIFAGSADQPVTKEDLVFATDEIPQIEAGC